MEVLVIIMYSIAGVTTTYFTDNLFVSLTKDELTDELLMFYIFDRERNSIYVFDGPDYTLEKITDLSTIESGGRVEDHYELISKSKLIFLDSEMIEIEYMNESTSLFKKTSGALIKKKGVYGKIVELDDLNLTANQYSALGFMSPDNCPIGDFYSLKKSIYTPKFYDKGEEETLLYEVKKIYKENVDLHFFEKYKDLVKNIKN